MTKIGEGAEPKKPGLDTYKAELDASTGKFLQTLEQYDKSESGQAQAHLRAVMDQQMEIIQSSVRELKKAGFHKEADKVAKDYKDYKDEESTENYTCLHNDVETLRELNKST